MIPKYEELMLPLLKSIADGEEHSLTETHNNLAETFSLSDEDLKKRLPSGTQPVFRNRVGWAKTYLKKAGLVDSTKRAHYKITDLGKEILSQNLTKIDSDFLKQFDSFIEFQSSTKTNSDTKDNDSDESNETTQTPEEVLEFSYLKIRNELANELLALIKSCSPDFFENLVVDVILRMGYGGSRNDAGQAMGKSGDGGIDGIINEDKLGLDVIYLQAKRWENTVPVKEIRDFTGALASKKARKGIFITTSNFPKSVYEFVSQVEYKIVLIDGERLANLMIDYNVGLSTVSTYEVKTIDTDYFSEL